MELSFTATMLKANIAVNATLTLARLTCSCLGYREGEAADEDRGYEFVFLGRL